MFSQIPRTTCDTKSHGETDWAYLDRSGRPEAQQVRDLLTLWLAAYPAGHRADLVARMSGGDDTAFQAAAFELMLYSALSRLGCNIEIHPELFASSKRPDFLITSATGERAYVEAISASEFSAAAKAARRRTQVVLDAIEKVDSPDFFIAVDADGDPQTPPNARQLRDELQRWISGLDYDAITADIAGRGDDALPQFSWNHEDWEISFEAIPKKEDRRGQGQRTIGLLFGDARWIAPDQPIRKAIKFKGKRYGELPHPLLIAINVDAISIDRIDEMNALFGDEQFLVRRDGGSAEPEMRRAPNGAWRGPSGPEYKRVSGVWIFRGINPWNIASRIHTLYFHPFATRPLPTVFDALPHARAREGIMEWSEGSSIRELLGLPEGWPGSP